MEAATEKTCSQCKRLLLIDQFFKRSDQPGKYTSHCRACRIEEKRRYNESHAPQRKAYSAAYYAENKDSVNDRIKKCIAADPDKYRAIHATWKQANKDAVNASTHRRRARLRHNGGSWTEDDWQRLKARYDWRCLMCGKQEMTDGITLCFDHVVPLSMGGFNVISNGQPLCRPCNSLKHRKTLDLRPHFLKIWP